MHPPVLCSPRSTPETTSAPLSSHCVRPVTCAREISKENLVVPGARLCLRDGRTCDSRRCSSEAGIMARMVQMGRGVWPNARPLIRRSVSPASDPGFLLNVGSLSCTVYPWRKAQAIKQDDQDDPEENGEVYELSISHCPLSTSVRALFRVCSEPFITSDEDNGISMRLASLKLSLLDRFFDLRRRPKCPRPQEK